MVKVCVVGCLHGELDKVYKDIARIEEENSFHTDLIICCGDFQSIRNANDVEAMSVPKKYQVMGDFWRYYAGTMKATIPTIFVGGNHEASNYLQELPYGGWVAPNIYYMGYAGVVQFGGLRIAGLSGIYKLHDFCRGHFERPPYTENTKRSVYHTRNIDVFRLNQIQRPVDIVVSHDWPRGIYHYGDLSTLLRWKPHFTEEVQCNSLGSEESERLLCRLQPRYWFAAHMHVKFPALVRHGTSKETRFLALDKCLPRREYLQFLDIEPCISLPSSPSSSEGEGEDSAESQSESRSSNTDNMTLALDPEWLCILNSTDHLFSLETSHILLPSRHSKDRFDFAATDEEIKEMRIQFDNQLSMPDNFKRTAPPFDPDAPSSVSRQSIVNNDIPIYVNPQTTLLCEMLNIKHPNQIFAGSKNNSSSSTSNPNIGNSFLSVERSDDMLNLEASDEEEGDCSSHSEAEEVDDNETSESVAYVPSKVLAVEGADGEQIRRIPLILPPPKNVDCEEAENQSSYISSFEDTSHQNDDVHVNEYVP